MIEGSGGSSASRRGPPRGVAFEWLREPLRRARDAAARLVWGASRHRERSDAFLWQLRFAGRVFWVILVGLAAYLVVDLWVLQPTLPSLNVQAGPQPEAGSAPNQALLTPMPEEQLKQAAAYRQTLASRNPFRLSTGRLTEEPVSLTTEHILLERTGKLVVVGINRGTVPEALIEDSEAKRTYFVKIGDEINGMRISAIDQTGVTVTYEGEETLLK